MPENEWLYSYPTRIIKDSTFSPPYSSLHGSLSSSRLSLAEIGVENEGETKEEAEGTHKSCYFIISGT